MRAVEIAKVKSKVGTMRGSQTATAPSSPTTGAGLLLPTLSATVKAMECMNGVFSTISMPTLPSKPESESRTSWAVRVLSRNIRTPRTSGTEQGKEVPRRGKKAEPNGTLNIRFRRTARDTLGKERRKEENPNSL